MTDPSVAAVVVGLDMAINYYKLSVAFRYLHLNAATAFIATNADSTYPSDKGLLPGAGAVWSPLTTALGPARPPTVIGKPNVHMMDAIKAKSVNRTRSLDLKLMQATGTILTRHAQSWSETGSTPTSRSVKQAGWPRSSFLPACTLPDRRRSLTDVCTTGIISEADLVGSAITPDYVTPSLGDLRAAIEQ